MRILVVSDSHGKNDDIKRVIEQVGDIDMFIHLGDVEKNCEQGIFGSCNNKAYALTDEAPLPIGLKQEIVKGRRILLLVVVLIENLPKHTRPGIHKYR